MYPECCDEVSYDDTGRRPVLRGRLSWFGKGQFRLFDCQAGDPSLWYAVTQSLKQCHNKGLHQRLLHRDEGVTNALGN